MKKVKVLIAGGGPVGLATAALLAAQGIASAVIEADEGFCTGSRAICLSRRSLEILSWCGAAKAIVEKGLAWTSGVSYFRDEEVLRFEMPHDADQRFAPMTNIQQFYVEQSILEGAQKNYPDLVDVRWKSRLVAVKQNERSVRVMVQNETETYDIEADYLIACDGGRSTVREQLGLELKGKQYEGRYVIVDVMQKSTRLQTQPVQRLAWFDPPSNPGSTVLMHRQPDDVWRIDYQVRDDEDPLEAVKPENVLPRVKAHLEWMGEKEPWQPLWISIYNAKCLTLDEYRHGRIFFAGDAAHLVPIFGVRGLNSGLDDAGNLAWKLAAVMKNQAGDALLDTYSQERRAAALVNIEFGSKSTEFMSPPHRGFDLMRQAVLRLAGSTPEVRSLINPRQSQAVRYGKSSDSRISSVDFPAIESKLSNGFLTESFGASHVLLCFGQKMELPHLPIIALSELERKVLMQSYDATEQSSFLIRPDGYIAARWDRAVAASEVQAALAKSLHLTAA